MAQAKILTVGGTNYEMIDDTARTNATTALNNTEYNRQGLIGKYPGQSLATLLAGEVSGSATIYDALHKRVQAANFSGMRVGDYIDVPLVSASNVAAQQSVRFLLAHFDPYYQCGDSAKGHHIAFIASAPVAVAKTVTGVANDSFLMWNTTNTNQGTADQKCPYLGSNLKTWETAFEACLPEGLTKYLLTQRVLLEERYSASGALNDSNSWSWQDIGKVWSPSEMEVYGCPVWGTKGYSVGFDCQFDLFRDTAHRLNGTRYRWWLRSVVVGSSSYVCYVTSHGNATTIRRRPPGFAPAPASSSASQPSALYFSFDATALRGRIPARAAGRFFLPLFPGGARERRLPAKPRGVRVQVLHAGHRHPRGGQQAHGLLVGRAESLQAAERSPHGGDRAQHRIQRQPRRLLLPQQFVQRA